MQPKYKAVHFKLVGLRDNSFNAMEELADASTFSEWMTEIDVANSLFQTEFRSRRRLEFHDVESGTGRKLSL